MIELIDDQLVFFFPDVHPKAKLFVRFKRTLRVSDDNIDHPLPPEIGSFPVRHIDDYASSMPDKWIAMGGVMLPLYQSEAMFIEFKSMMLSEHNAYYPFAVKIASGKINAIGGNRWTNGLNNNGQDYIVVPLQSRLDGYYAKQGTIRQFVGMPLGSGHSVEEQITGFAEYGGIQIQVYPMYRKVFEYHFPKKSVESECYKLSDISFCAEKIEGYSLTQGVRLRQEIVSDPYRVSDWDVENTSRCFVHLVNSLQWKSITGYTPPTWLPTAKEYANIDFPWYENYCEGSDIEPQAPKKDNYHITIWDNHEGRFKLSELYRSRRRKKVLAGYLCVSVLENVMSFFVRKGIWPVSNLFYHWQTDTIVKLKKKFNLGAVRDSIDNN